MNSVDYLRSLLSLTPIGLALEASDVPAEGWFQLHELLRGERHLWLDQATKACTLLAERHKAGEWVEHSDYADIVRELKTKELGDS